MHPKSINSSNAMARGAREAYKVPNHHHVEELQCPDDHEKRHEYIEQLYALRCLGYVFVPYAL
jgi:hypothetical protein